AVSQIKDGDKVGGAMEAVNAAAGTVKGLSDNQGTRQTNYVNVSVGAKGAREAQANSNFYANIGVNAGFTRSRSNTSSHTEGAAVTTLKPMDENSSITYNNVNNITYQGTQAQGGTFIYNNVANIQKEAVELHNSYSSSSSSRGVNAGATIGYGHKIQTTGNGGSISTSRSNQNTVETVYANGNFKNVNEVHNNTGSMVLNGFNQEGGKVTGNIGKVEVISRQNTSTTTGSSSGISLGISANGM
ncbi:hemagglutinin repeat-containing protein, partial [Leptotrichia sp. oral taxon 879]|uniref:hemagglutinin repeat-containing protein n=1 Tax=Leptotrichia sp. oral taxon 879 TaxID=1227267 RepID=UPI0003AD8A8E